MPADNQAAGRAAHWETVYRTKGEAEVSWHQEEPALSLALVRELAPPRGRVVDVGGGSSILAGRLAALGLEVTVLDISASAIERARTRIGDLSRRVQWIVADVTEIDDIGRFDVWHDRGVFHFLTDERERRRYVALAGRSVRGSGHVVIGTFAKDGPPMCSGLSVERYDEAAIAAAFGPKFTPVRSVHDTHMTPWGKPQSFLFSVLRKE